MSDSDLLVLVDGSSYLFRAYHAMPQLTNAAGESTGAMYGVINMLKRLRNDYDTERTVVVFDAKGPTFRNVLYDQYKANRPPMPDDLRSQIEPLHEIIRALGFPLLSISGVEADDVIGTLVHRAREAGLRTLISTGDKDMAQLVDEDTHIINTMDGSLLDPQGVEKKFGVLPERIVDYLTLVGDTVDNVPGVPKVGPKTAVKWLSTYGSLDDVMRCADEIKGKVGEHLRASLGYLPLSRELVTIKTDVELEHAVAELVATAPDTQALQEFYGRYEFKTWLSELLGVGGQAPAEAVGAGAPAGALGRGEYDLVLDEEALATWMSRLAKAPHFAFDTETTSLNYMEAVIVGVSFSIEPGTGAYVPCGHDYIGAPDQLGREFVLEQLRPLLEASAPKKILQNAKYDMSVLATHGITLTGADYDTMLESYVMDSTATRHDMDSLALKYLHYNTIHFEDVAGKGAKQIPFPQVELSVALDYAAEDADITLRLHEHLWPQLQAQERLRVLFEDIEMPLVEVLSAIERTGVMIDPRMLAQQSEELAVRQKEVEREAHEVAGELFNLGSPKQIQALLYDKLELPVLAKTPKGQPSTAESVMQELAHDYDLPRLILEYRSLSKLRSTYTEALPACINPVTRRVHTNYRQAVASTGRLSSSEPNLQNIPVRTHEGRRIRQAFVAPQGFQLLAADYSQIELRIMAHLSGDEGLLRAFEENRDIHSATAAEVFAIPEQEVDVEHRRRAKAVNFGLIYGMSAFGLGRQLGIERSEAQSYVDRYFERYPGVKEYMERTRETAREQGFVETVFGRRLYLPEINARNAARRQYAERTAINAPMQGTAADIIKRAMITLHRWGESHTDQARMIMQVHDELVFEVADDFLDEAKSVIVDQMTQAVELRVPLVVDVGIGANWDEAH
jgi:DNA polymerase-1